jgi:hypothetical protein
MAGDIRHLFHVLSDHCQSSLEKCLLRAFSHFQIVLLVFLLSCKISSYTLGASSLKIYGL